MFMYCPAIADDNKKIIERSIKMKLSKKIIAMSLVAALAASTLTACGGNNGDTPEPTANSEEKNTDPEEPAATDEGGSEVVNSGNKKTFDDLGGMEIKVGDFYTGPEEDPSTQYAEDTYNYRQDIFDKYNFTVTREKMSSFADMAETFTTEVISGNPSMDIYYLYQDMVNEPLKNNLLYDLSKVQTVDFSEEKWNKQVIDLMTYDGGIYGMSTELEPRACIFFNKRLFEESGISPDEPYELQASGQWTWDKFEEYCKKLTRDIDKDGVTDVYAMASFSKDYFKLAAASNGAQFVSKDENGKYVNATKSQNFLDAANWAVDLIKKGYIQPKEEGASWDWFITAFRDGECAMQTAEAYTVSSFSDSMDDPFGIVMFPAGPNGDMATVPFDNVVVVPSCFDDDYVEKLMFGYDLYTECTPGWTLDESWRQNYYAQFKDPDRDVDETLAMMREDKYRIIDYQSMIANTDYGDFTYTVQALGATPQEQLESMTPTWDGYIKKANGE